MLAAAKVLDTDFPQEAALAASDLVAPGKRASRELESGDVGEMGLDVETALAIVDGITALQDWMWSGGWVADEEPPRLLTMIQDAVDRTRTGAGPGPVGLVELIGRYRDLVQWGESFVEQRPTDQAARDELVLLTAVRIRLLAQSGGTQDPVRAKNLLADPAGRLGPGWGDDNAVGITALSKGHFNNDQEHFIDICRALVVDLLDRAVAKRDGRTIYLSTSVFEQATGRLRAELDQKIREALEQGWRVVHVLDRSGGAEDEGPRHRVRADFATHLLADLETRGRYVPLRSAPADATDMVLVEGVGAVVFPSVGHSAAERVRQGALPSPAMAVRCITGRGGRGDGPAATPIVAELRAEARALYGDVAEAYMDKRTLHFGFRIPTEDLLWFDRQLTASELLEGDRYAVKSVLPTSTLPDELSSAQFDAWQAELERLWEGDTEASGLTSGWPIEVVERAVGYLHREGRDRLEQSLRRLRNKRNVRHFGFETNTADNSYRDCVLKADLDQYLTEEDPWFDPNPLYGPGGLTLEQRQQHLLYLVTELDKTRVNHATGRRVGYHLGLLDGEVAQPYDLSRTWWLATGSADGRADQVHFLYNPSGAATFVATLKDDSLSEFDAVDTFVSLFDGMWYTIRQEDRTPDHVIDFILDRLPASLRSEYERHRP